MKLLNCFLIMPFSNPYEMVYTEVILPVLKKYEITPVRADSIFTSTEFFDDIRNEIKKCDLVIVIVSQNNNVFLELGFAIQEGKELIALTDNVSNIPSDLKHIRHLLYSLDDLKNATANFEKWIKQTTTYKKQQRNVLSRGENIDGIIDSVVAIDLGEKSNSELLIADIKKKSLLPCKYYYLTATGTGNWLHLCNDPHYTVYRESIDFFLKNSNNILDDCGEGFIYSFPDIISIGCGDGQKDRILIKEFIRKYKSDRKIGLLYYYPYDISEKMASRAVSTLREDNEISDFLKIKQVVADFKNINQFKPVFDYRENPNLFLFLGNTLGNLQDEIAFLIKVKSVMNSGDILILEFRRSQEALNAGGETEIRKTFSFSPLNELLGLPKYMNENLTYQEIESISQIPSSKTLATYIKNVTINNEFYEEILLSCINYYDIDSLKMKLSSSPLSFDILGTYSTPQLGILIIKKR